MYAIIATGGKQYKVAEGDIIKVEKLNAEEGSEVSFDVVAVNTDKDVLCGDACKSASVKATVLGEGKGKKVVVYKYKRKTAIIRSRVTDSRLLRLRLKQSTLN